MELHVPPGCLHCGDRLALLRSAPREDYEYGVHWRSRLMICPACGLVSQDPPVTPEQVKLLYPSNYLAHSGASRSPRSIYGRLKHILGRRSAQSVARHLPPCGSCLEVGCGDGGFLRALGEVRPDVELAGVDIVDLGIQDLGRFRFIEGQLEEIDFAGQRFDLIYCSNLLEHVPDPFLFLRKCAAILHPGGVIHGITPDHLSVDRRLLGRYWAGYHYPRHTFVFDHRNIEQILAKCGFEQIRVRGSYAFWYLSLCNRFVHRPGSKARGLAFAAVTAFFLPFDWLVNRFRVHGSMTFTAHARAPLRSA